jgi:hypothetical protein
MIKHIYAKHLANGGGSTRFDGSTPQRGFAVGMPWTSGTTQRREWTEADIERFINKYTVNLHAEAFDHVAIGTWYDEATGLSWIELSLIIEDRAAAIALGRQFGQIAIADLSKSPVQIIEIAPAVSEFVEGLVR